MSGKISDNTFKDHIKIVLTNQSGVSNGMFSLDEVNYFNNALNKMLIKREKKSLSQNIEHQKVKGGV